VSAEVLFTPIDPDELREITPKPWKIIREIDAAKILFSEAIDTAKTSVAFSNIKVYSPYAKDANGNFTAVGSTEYGYYDAAFSGDTLILTPKGGSDKWPADLAVTVKEAVSVTGRKLENKEILFTVNPLGRFFLRTKLEGGAQREVRIADRDAPIVLEFSQDVKTTTQAMIEGSAVRIFKIKPTGTPLVSNGTTSNEFLQFETDVAGNVVTLAPVAGFRWPAVDDGSGYNGFALEYDLEPLVGSESDGVKEVVTIKTQASANLFLVTPEATELEIQQAGIAGYTLPSGDPNALGGGDWYPIKARSKNDSLVLSFSEALDVTGFSQTFEDDGSNLIVDAKQVLDLKFSSDKKTVTIKTIEGRQWVTAAASSVFFTIKGLTADVDPINGKIKGFPNNEVRIILFIDAADLKGVKPEMSVDTASVTLVAANYKPAPALPSHYNPLTLGSDPDNDGGLISVPTYGKNPYVYLKLANPGDKQTWFNFYVDLTGGRENPQALPYTPTVGQTYSVDGWSWLGSAQPVTEENKYDTVIARISLPDNPTANWVTDSAVFFVRAENSRGLSRWSDGVSVSSRPTILTVETFVPNGADVLGLRGSLNGAGGSSDYNKDLLNEHIVSSVVQTDLYIVDTSNNKASPNPGISLADWLKANFPSVASASLPTQTGSWYNGTGNTVPKLLQSAVIAPRVQFYPQGRGDTTFTVMFDFDDESVSSGGGASTWSNAWSYSYTDDGFERTAGPTTVTLATDGPWTPPASVNLPAVNACKVYVVDDGIEISALDLTASGDVTEDDWQGADPLTTATTGTPTCSDPLTLADNNTNFECYVSGSLDGSLTNKGDCESNTPAGVWQTKSGLTIAIVEEWKAAEPTHSGGTFTWAGSTETPGSPGTPGVLKGGDKSAIGLGVLNATVYESLITPTSSSNNLYTTNPYYLAAARNATGFRFPFASVRFTFNQEMNAKSAASLPGLTASGTLADGKIDYRTQWVSKTQLVTTFYRKVTTGIAAPVDARVNLVNSYVMLLDTAANYHQNAAVSGLTVAETEAIAVANTGAPTALRKVLDIHNEADQTLIWENATPNVTQIWITGISGVQGKPSASANNKDAGGADLTDITVSSERAYKVRVTFLTANDGVTLERAPKDALAGASPATFDMEGFVGANQVPYYVYESNSKDKWWVGEGSNWGKTIDEGPISFKMFYDQKKESGFPVKWNGERPVDAVPKPSI
jgi:hypothetical protein